MWLWGGGQDDMRQELRVAKSASTNRATALQKAKDTAERLTAKVRSGATFCTMNSYLLLGGCASVLPCISMP